MTPRILRTVQARLDYLEIWEYIALDNVNAADALVDEFESHLRLLATSPSIGRSRSELFPNLRSFPLGNYLLFYRRMENGIELIRVLHSARDIDQSFFSERLS